MSAYGVDALRFRVYRINDPVQFMRQLGDAHQFGGSYAVPNGKLTLLERLHQWKANLRRNIRQQLRRQFTEAPSQHLTILQPSSAPANKAAYFADAPVLNPRQLVLSFLQPVARTANRWDTRQVDIPVKDKGVFLVEAVKGNLSAYTVLTVSDLVLLTKVGREHIVYYVANRSTGEPVPNARISTFERNEEGTVAQTGKDGTVEAHLGKGQGGDDLRIVATSGPDAAVSDIGSWSLNQSTRTLAGLIYTDRPVYRPGDTVHFRSILRWGRAIGYDIPAGESLRVQVQDRDGKPVYDKTLRTNGNGILHDQFVLAKVAPLGFFFLQVQSPDTSSSGASVSGSFNVQEYKKPEYEVRATPQTRRLLQGATTPVTVDARYYFGEPVANATVHYSIFKSRYWFPFFYEGNDEDDNDQSGAQENDDDTGDRLKNLEGKLDENGKLTITLPTDISKDHTDALYRIEAGVTDKGGREISGTGYVVGTYGSFVLNIEPDRWLFKPNEDASFKLMSRDYDNKGVSTPVELELHRYNPKTHTLEGEAIGRTKTITDEQGNGTATLHLPPGTGGEYELIAKAPSGSRTVEARQYLWVSGGNNGWADEGGEAGTVPMITDKKSYTPGDTAKVMVVTGGTNIPVLMTVEGRDIQSHTIIRGNTGGTATLTVPITKSNEPGLFVSASFLKNGKLFNSTKRLRVPPEDHKLNIQLSTDKPDYRPGQTARYHISVKSPDGKPVKQTDLSLGVVDEAIYAIEKDNTPDLLNTFYGRDYNQVQSLDSLTYYFSGEAGTRRMQLAALRPATRLAQLKPEPIVRPKIRKYFPDTTFWANDITTNDKGEADAQVPFPDSLTTWRATARGASIDDRYGQANLKTIVRKNLILRLAVPRFAVQGDEVVISAIVHNYLQSDKQVRIQLTKLTGLQLLNGTLDQTITVPQKGEGTATWRIKATQIGNAAIEAQALTNEESDALHLDLPIHPPGLKIREPHSGSIANTGTKTLTVSYGDDSLPGSRSLEIRLAPSIAGSLFNALDYLSSYGYGCVEQTMSSFVPDIVVRQAMHELKLKPRLDEAELNRRIKTGLDRITGLRHEDGGWGWWVTDDSHPFMTAYVVAGLAQARSAGVTINANEITGGVKWLVQYAKDHKNLPPDLNSYMRYAAAMAGGGDRNALNALYTGRSSLSPEGLA
ncbi:MAG: alpha-2-macroglobulin, partial [Rhodospirillales bacterium]|nr:alpha-2-macroglobulin [Acetobacter sp.]